MSTNNTENRSKGKTKAGKRLRINCLKAYLKTNDLPRPMGSELIESPNYAYKRVKPYEPKPAILMAKPQVKAELVEEVST